METDWWVFGALMAIAVMIFFNGIMTAGGWDDKVSEELTAMRECLERMEGRMATLNDTVDRIGRNA